jgi:hypothetical protein
MLRKLIMLKKIIILLLLVFSPWASLAGTRAQSGGRYGFGTLHPGQILRGSLPLLSPLLYKKNFMHFIFNYL